VHVHVDDHLWITCIAIAWISNKSFRIRFDLDVQDTGPLRSNIRCRSTLGASLQP
jgi:hypothetical protein